MTNCSYHHAQNTFNRLLTFVLGVVTSFSVAASDLNVSVFGQKSADGDIIIVLYPSTAKNSFPTQTSSATCIEKTKAAIELN